jgi:hypothetical protein
MVKRLISGSKLRKWIWKLHLYGGLLCFWYLIIFAVTSLQFQHQFAFLQPKVFVERDTLKVAPLNLNNTDSAVATKLRTELNIAGWYLPWETYRDEQKKFHTEIESPKANYKLEYNSQTSSILISKKEKGLWGIIKFLHGFAGGMPGAPMLIVWEVYTYLSLFVVLFSIISGVWLWATKRVYRKDGLLFIGLTLVAVLLVVLIYLKG